MSASLISSCAINELSPTNRASGRRPKVKHDFQQFMKVIAGEQRLADVARQRVYQRLQIGVQCGMR